MKRIILKSKSNLIVHTLKILGVCGVIFMFEACYGTPKSVWAPRHDGKQNNLKDAKGTVNTDFATAPKITHRNQN